MIRIAVLHDLTTGLAEEPTWGPMCGPAAVSEQQLAQSATRLLPSGAIVIGDRNFGGFRGLTPTAVRFGCGDRLTAEQALKVAGEPIGAKGERSVCWTPGAYEKRRHTLPEDAKVSDASSQSEWGEANQKYWLFTEDAGTSKRICVP